MLVLFLCYKPKIHFPKSTRSSSSTAVKVTYCGFAVAAKA
jgi:hypothetical protein